MYHGQRRIRNGGVNVKDCPVIPANEVDLSRILTAVPVAQIQRGRKYPKDRNTGEKYYYLDLITAFDIETSKEKFAAGEQDWRSWMYVWQWQIGDICTIIGRTWDEFITLVKVANATLPDNVRLMVYVHKLAFEFQFLSGVWEFAPEDVFATDVRSPLYCKMGNLELRCGYRLSGYSLDKWAEDCQSDHQKLVGELDYNVVRYPWTPLTDQELAYCINDVIVVVECVMIMLAAEGDTLYTIPYTNTGYIRRRVRAAMRMWSPTGVQTICGDLYTYDRLREVFRGGNTHANRWYVNQLIGDVYSYDRSSSYPDVMVHCKFPMSRFRDEDPTLDRLQQLVSKGRAIIARLAFVNIRLSDDSIGLPYLPIDRMELRGYHVPIGAQDDNRRLLSAAYCEIAVTDLDLEIIQSQYEWDAMEVHWLMSSRYGYLPQPLTDILIDLYRKKTALKDLEGHEVQYNHAKAQLNSSYGMMVQRVISNAVEYVDNHWRIQPDFDRLSEYNKAIEHAFLAYQWGVWVSAWGRYRLQEGVVIAEQLHPAGLRSSFRICGHRFCKINSSARLLPIQRPKDPRREALRRIRARPNRKTSLHGRL